MGDTAEVNISDTQRTYFNFKYKIPCCNYCSLFLPTITPNLLKIDKNAVWQLFMQDNVIILKLIKSEYDNSPVDVKTSYLPNTYTGLNLTHCKLVNEDISISGSLKLHTVNTSYLCKCNRQMNPSKSVEILCELFIHPQKNKSNLKFLSKDFKCLLQKETLSDLTLVTNQQEFHVHKAVLSARSSVFNAMFHSEMKETKENKVVIKDINGEVMNQVLLYIYTGRINAQIVKNIAENVLVAADKYALERLKFICGLVLSFNLTAENIFYNSALAEQYEIQHLKKAIVRFMTNSQDKIVANISNTVDDSPESSEKEEDDLE